MGMTFNCASCGRKLKTDAAPGRFIRCPACQTKMAVPAPAPVPSNDKPAPAIVNPTQLITEEVVDDTNPNPAAKRVNYIPLIVSGIIHATLIVLALGVTTLVAEHREQVDVIVPEAVLANDDSAGTLLVQNTTLAGFDTGNVPSRIAPANAGPSGIDAGALSGPAGDPKNKVDLIGVNSASGGGSVILSGAQDTGGSALAPKSKFFGSGGNAYHIVYVIDRSGSMLETFDAIRTEMLSSIGRLKPEQSFHVILLTDGIPQEMKARRLVPATQDNKLQAADFLSAARPEGRTDPIPALNRAFAVLRDADRGRRGKLVYLLTDGVFPDNDRVLRLIRTTKEQDKDIFINTYLYGSQSPQAVDVLKDIAAKAGGLYKYVQSGQ